MKYTSATESDLPFIIETYEENIQALHGAHRSHAVWKNLLSDKTSAYYIVRADAPAAWFRIDRADDSFELGMLQVHPRYHRRGIGRFILRAAEDMAKDEGFDRIIIHTTEDNHAAQALYSSSGYALVEIGPCTTADGCERVGYTYQKEI